MDRKIGGYIVAGLAIGSALGLMWGPMIGNTALGIGIGALAGVFIGWFAAAAIRKPGKVENDKPNQSAGDTTAPGATKQKPD